ncbi:hypothetical protein V22_17620 [Calycomorphotria hydatis]|uniref:Gfo/Idh/MocA-like oxidoreductase N-terminal domain-containing protein n=2 Tax=Calycomorphotria hydatis TaxID=2528027 RepID=A0A517T840_9PLAN|nr:hypothetical protein V22_17620 [Calycomorphotria hydatis]
MPLSSRGGAVFRVGVAGLGPQWERKIFPSLGMQRRRVEVTAVFDRVEQRTKREANLREAFQSRGVQELAEHPDLRAVLVLEKEEVAGLMAELICPTTLPIFLANPPLNNSPLLSRLHARARQCRTMLIPALPLRFAPTTSRLKELIATDLGPVSRIELDGTEGASSIHLAEIVDWCSYLAKADPVEINQVQLNESGNQTSIEARMSNQDQSRSALLKLVLPASFADEHACHPPLLEQTTEDWWQPITVHCENGSATLETKRRLAWTLKGRTYRESLTSDASEAQVMLDHFFRRASGGLIPTADLRDVERAVVAAHAITKAIATREPSQIHFADADN